MMEYRFLGNSGLKVSVISLGGWLNIGSEGSEELAYQCMTKAYELGINFFDNAETYSQGKSEEIFGRVFKKAGWKRSEFVVSTKIFWGGQGVNQRGLSRKHIIEGVKGALDRMGLDYVDIVFAHRPDLWTPMEEIVRAFNYIIEQGQSFYWGTSEWSAQQIAEAHAVAQRLNLIAPVVEQPEYNMFKRDKMEKEYLPLFSTSYKMGTTVWSPLAGGVLTGKYVDKMPEDGRLSLSTSKASEREKHILERISNSYFKEETGKEKLQKVKQLIPVAHRLGCSITQLALAWVLKNPNVSTAIIGASKVAQIEENVKALEVLPKLTQDIMDELEAILKNKPISDIDYRSF